MSRVTVPPEDWGRLETINRLAKYTTGVDTVVRLYGCLLYPSAFALR